MLKTREIQDWLITRLSELLDITPDSIDINQPFSSYGLSSLDVVTLSGDLEELLGRRFSPTLAYEYPNILALSRYLTEDVENLTSDSTVNTMTDNMAEPIAIIGIGCRFPGANDPESFWKVLHDEVDMIREVPVDRWQKQAFYHPDPTIPGKSISYWGGFLESIDQFDPFFFGISPIEAEHMDPQQRLLLELSNEALDDAGQIKEKIDGSKTGVFIGISVNEYSQLQFSDPRRITSHSGTGSALAIAANRISYFYNFHGPSIALDTACSSSLSAVHLACQSLRHGECKMALAGGVNLILSPAHSISFTKAGLLAPDGRCKTFDARANGYVRGEGGGVVILKPLSVALADGDPIQALILGSAMIQDGRSNGLVAPNPEAQEAMLNEAYRAAGITPRSVQFVEAHGTGTLLGDSMEAKALGAVIGKNRKNSPCAIGSVKSNIGHLEAAAGIAGLIKVILILKHRIIPPSLHYQSPNPHIPFKELNLRVQNELNSWPSDNEPAIAGVSSFGFGGTNVHVVVQEASIIKTDKEKEERLYPSTSPYFLLPLSANSDERLKSLARTFLELLSPDSSIATNDICWAASFRRSQYDYRMAVIGNSRMELCTSLTAFIQEEPDPNLFLGDKVPDRQPKLVYVFPGQGGQWYGMGQELLKQEPVFYQAIDRIDRIVKLHYSWSLMDELTAERSRLDEIDIVQPLLFAIQVALSELWQSWGITPDAVIGHSMGEVAAAHIAGILSLEDAIKVICGRSQLLKKLTGKGSMLLTELSPNQSVELLKGYENNLSIAAFNSPTSTVLSGDIEAVKEVMESLQQKNLFCKLVNVDVASHSPQMDQVRTELLETLDVLHPQTAKIPLYSTVTGTQGNSINFNAEYWMDNLRKPVLFSEAIRLLIESKHSTFIEIGPHPVLLSSVKQTIPAQHQEVLLLPSLRREEPEKKILLSTLGVLYGKGYSIYWNSLFPNRGKHIHLPLIPWQRQRYWLNTNSTSPKNTWHWGQSNDKKSHPLLGDRLRLANSPSSYIWQTTIDTQVLSFLTDHRIEDEIVFPAAAYIEMALQSAEELGIKKSHELSELVFKESMILDKGNSRSVQTSLSPQEDNRFLFNIYSRNSGDDNWVMHASAIFLPNLIANDMAANIGCSPDLIREQSTSHFSSDEFYQTLQQRGIVYGPSFRAIQDVWSKDDKSLGRISIPESLLYDCCDYQIHPALLDACLQVLAGTQIGSLEHNLFLPTGCDSIRFFLPPDQLTWSLVTLRPTAASGKDAIIADIRLLDSHNKTVAELLGFSLQRTSRRIRHLLSQQDTWLYHMHWEAKKSPNPPDITSKEARHWLIFAEDEGISEELVMKLETQGDHCQVLTHKEIIEKLDNSNAISLHEIIDNLIKGITPPLYGIIHLWSLSITSISTSQTCSATDQMQMIGCNSVLFLVHSLTNRLAGSPRLWLVTRGSQAVKSFESVTIEQSPIWGLGKVISFELPELNCIRIDLDPAQTNSENVQLLLKQISIDDREDQVAFRAEVRFVLRLLPFTFSSTSGLTKLSFRTDGTYLITGGLGGLGLKTAEWMARRGARHLVLMGRSKPSQLAMSTVDQMRNGGIEIIIEQADVSDAVQLKKVLDSIRKNLPALRGIIHAAGVLDDGALLNLNAERMKKVMAPKVDGTWNLHILSMDLPLDFFVLYSSAVSVLGSPGQGNYAAASAYLDAMAYYRRTLGLPAISINWGPWDEVGLAAEATERLKEQNASTQHLIKVIKIDQGLEILEQILKETTPQVMVLPFDLRNLIELYPTAAGMPFLSEVGGTDSYISRFYARPKLRHKYIAPRNEVERKIAELWRQTLHIDLVGVQDSFFELGGDSVLAAQILALAQKTFGIRINPQEAFKAFTIERLAEMLEAEILSKIEQMSEEEVQQQLSKRKK